MANSTNISINNLTLITTFKTEKTEKNANNIHRKTSCENNRQPRQSITAIDTHDNSITIIVKHLIPDFFAKILTNKAANKSAHWKENNEVSGTTTMFSIDIAVNIAYTFFFA